MADELKTSKSITNISILKYEEVDGYNYTIGLCRFFLRILGAWPDPYHENTWPSSIHFFITLSFLILFGTVSQTIKLIECFGDLNAVMEILSNCDIPTTIATVKIFSIWYHRYVLKNLVQQIIEDWTTSYSKFELSIMWKNAKISRLFSIGFILVNEGSFISYTCACYLLPLYQTLKLNNETMELPLYIKGSFPYDPQEHPNYTLTILAQLITIALASFSFCSADSFFVILMFHLISQLTILKHNVYDLPKNIENSSETLETQKSFSSICFRHNQLWRFSSSIEETFNIMFLIQIIPCTLTLCTQSYQLLMITDADSIPIMELIFAVCFLLMFLMTIFAYCYVAEIVREKSMEMGHAAYNCDWTELPVKESRLLVLLIMRAQHPFEVTVGKFKSFSLQLYCSILKTAAGYLSLLLAVKDKMVN